MAWTGKDLMRLLLREAGHVRHRGSHVRVRCAEMRHDAPDSCRRDASAGNVAPDSTESRALPREGVVDIKYTVRFERDESGQWIATIPRVRGCHTHGRSLDEARNRVREALSLFVKNAETADLVDDIRLPVHARTMLRKVRDARTRARVEQARAARMAQHAADTLHKRLRLSVRDTGQLLGLSHQRIHQLVDSGK